MIKHVFEPQSSTGKRNVAAIILVISSFIAGWGMMALLAIFEDDIKLSIGGKC
jgi:hypothetical protein